MTQRNRLGWWLDTHPMHLVGWGYALVVIALIVSATLFGPSAHAQTAPAVSITLSPATGTVPYSSTLTWSASGAASCVAGGAWSGAKPSSGSQTVTIAAAGQVYKLDCASPVQQPTTSWTPPTKNTDGTALTPTGYQLQESVDGASWRNDVTKAATDTSHVWSGLSPGLHYFQIRTLAGALASAWLAKGDDGTMVSTTVPAPLIGSGSATGGVTSVPNPPSGFKVTASTIAFELREYSGGTLRFVQVGTVPKGAPCPGAKLAGDYRAFSGATITKATTGGIIAARCI